MGTLTVRDSSNLFSEKDLTALRENAKHWPFDLHLLAENAPNFSTLESNAHEWVDGPNVMVVAIDPAAHKVVTRFGNATNVKTGDFDSIAKAGNAHFRSGQWAQGVEAIAMRAEASAQAKQAMVSSNEPVVVERGLSTGAWFGIGFLVLAFAGLAIWLYRRNKKQSEAFQKALDENRLETAELRSQNIREQQWQDEFSKESVKPTVPSQPASVSYRAVPSATTTTCTSALPVANPMPVVNVNASNSGTDFVTGYALGSLASQPREVVREVVRVEPVAPVPRVEPVSRRASRSDDDGGSSSSYSGSSSSYSSSSSSDSGGSSSIWDSFSSSSFDSSSDSGGFDSGGGSSDW